MIRLRVYSRGARRRALIRTWASGRSSGEVRVALVPPCEDCDGGEALSPVTLGSPLSCCDEALDPASLDRTPRITRFAVVDLLDGVSVSIEAIETALATGVQLVAAWSAKGVDPGCEIAALHAGAVELLALDDRSERHLPSLATWLARYAGLEIEPPLTGRRAPHDRPALPQSPGALPLVLIASSTGGPQALVEILVGLPADLPAAIAIAQHMDPEHLPGTRTWLAEQTQLQILMPERPVTPKRGVVYLARGGDHLAVRHGGMLAYTDAPLRSVFRPSGDVLFESALLHAPGPLLGIVLTGMGRDGARGLGALRRAGHRTIAQDEKTSVIYGMPKAAAEAGAVERIRALGEIAGEIRAWASAPPRAGARGRSSPRIESVSHG